MERATGNDFRRTILFKLNNTHLETLKKKVAKLYELKCGETRNESQVKAYEYHKNNLDTFISSDYKTCQEFDSNDSLNTEILHKEEALRFVEDESGLDYFEEPHEPYFYVFHVRAIYSDYFDEDGEGGEVDYQSEASEAHGVTFVSDNEEEEEEEDKKSVIEIDD